MTDPNSQNSYESIKSDLSKVFSVIVWIILLIGLLFILPSWFIGGLWKAICRTLDIAGWVCDGVEPYIPILAVVWVVGTVVMLLWALINRIRRR